MHPSKKNKDAILNDGYTIIDDIYSDIEIEQILSLINNSDTSNKSFRKSSGFFAIRQFLKTISATSNLIFNEKLKAQINVLFGEDYFVVKSIYFDKPETSNWFVAYHQDLTISVDKKIALEGFGPWTVKQNQFAVQPPIAILENIFTIRIHLDEATKDNGALKVVPKSHKKKIYRPETIDWEVEKETICEVKKGGIMIMKPLLLHSSSRTTNNKKRRVIHIEFSNQELPLALQWAEKEN